MWSENDDRKNTDELMEMLELDETMNKVAKLMKGDGMMMF